MLQASYTNVNISRRQDICPGRSRIVGSADAVYGRATLYGCFSQSNGVSPRLW